MDRVDLEQPAHLLRWVEEEGRPPSLVQIAEGTLSRCIALYAICNQWVQAQTLLVTASGAEFCGREIADLAVRLGISMPYVHRGPRDE